MAVYIFGHKNPDSDSVCAAIALADLKNKLGVESVAAVQGDLNPESKFVLEKFGVNAPELLSSGAGKQVILVDHSGIMLCAILSDTVIFKSVTCTDKDKEACEVLAKIAGESDLKSLGMEMFKVKSAIEGTPARELVLRDYKDFDMSGNKVGIGQLEVVDLSLLDSVKPALVEDIKALKEEGGRHSVFLMLTDIIKEGTEMLIASDDPSVVEKAFGTAPAEGKVWLDGVMSRKKQVVPNFEKAFAG
jgi:manganese-dependent inorganic pyrophosphatase